MALKESQSYAASGDIRSMLSVLLGSVTLSEDEFIEKCLGNLRFLYYLVIDKLHIRPVDMEEFIDALLYLDSVQYITEQELARHRRASANK